MRWKAFQDVLQIRIHVMPVETGGMDQAHHRRGTLARAQAAGK
jgi:hypothetical protein